MSRLRWLSVTMLWLITFLHIPIITAQNVDNAVYEATSLLHQIKVPSQRIDSAKRSGATYYAKQLIRALIFNGPSISSSDPSKLHPTLNDAVKILTEAAQSGSPDAIYLLAEMNFHGNYTHPRNYTAAFERYEQLASLTGNSTAQHKMGFMYATGIGGAVQMDQAKAMLYYRFAAEGGNVQAQMTLGYRHNIGIGTPKLCEDAVHYYRLVAEKAIEAVRAGPPGGHSIIRDSYRIADDEGGVYGEGASVSSAGPNAKNGAPHSDTHADFEDVVEYLDLLSRKGDIKATYQLGKLQYDGARGRERDLEKAKTYLMQAARQVWQKNNKVRKDVGEHTEKYASKAAGYLGRMFLRGEGVPPDFDKAKLWLKRGTAFGDAMSQYLLGIMSLYGHGVRQDSIRAAEYFAPAADQGLAAAQVRMGALFLDQGDVKTAMKYFELAAQSGHIEAVYYLAELTHQGIGRDKSCTMAAMYYKIVCEKAESFFATFKEANDAHEAGDTQTALVNYMLAAEQGFETAQANVAYLLDQSRPSRRKWLDSLFPGLTTRRKVAHRAASALKLLDPALALTYWTRSARQSNTDSTVKMGDYYLLGLGIKDSMPDAEKAAQCYQAAAEGMQMASAQAMWNLGWMHENGNGVEQDFHLAKRFYDLAAETNREAGWPVRLALAKLYVRGWWNWVSGGHVRAVEDDKTPRRPFSYSTFLTDFITAAYDIHFSDDEAEHAYGGGDYYDDDWASSPMPGGDAADLYDELVDFGEGVLESVVILVLATAFVGLLLYRRRRAEERENGARGVPVAVAVPVPAGGGGGNADPAQGGGLFPNPAEPEFREWVAGGVGR